MDSFKESLNQIELTDLVASQITISLPEAEVIKCPLADGGEGTLDVILSQTKGERVILNIRNPLMNQIETHYGLLEDKTAIIETAKAIGLDLIKPAERNPLKTTSYGVGEMILNALDLGVTNFIITLGGSSTTDGGTGMLTALGVIFYDKFNQPIQMNGAALNQIEKIDINQLDRRLEKCQFLIATDVDNPLFGPFGASYIYAEQKGANKAEIKTLDEGLKHFSQIVKRDLTLDNSDVSGAGAAGGLAYAFKSFLNAKIKSGVDIIFNQIKLSEKIKDVNLIFTGEGRIDNQSSMGKSLSGLAKIAKNQNISVIALAGSVTDNISKIHDQGITSAFSIIDSPMTLNEAINNTEKLIIKKVNEICRLIIAIKKER
jgi:glycerate 2-kinase